MSSDDGVAGGARGQKGAIGSRQGRRGIDDDEEDIRRFGSRQGERGGTWSLLSQIWRCHRLGRD